MEGKSWKKKRQRNLTGNRIKNRIRSRKRMRCRKNCSAHLQHQNHSTGKHFCSCFPNGLWILNSP